MAEKCLAKKILTCFGNHYGKPGYVAAAKQLQLLMAWCEPSIPVPGEDRDKTDEWELSMGLKSRVSLCMDRYGLSEDQAIERLKQVAAQEAKVMAFLPPPPPPKPTADQGGDEDATEGAAGEAEAAEKRGDEADPDDPNKASD